MKYEAGVLVFGKLSGEEDESWLDIYIKNILEEIFEYHAPIRKEITIFSPDEDFFVPFARAVNKKGWQLNLVAGAKLIFTFDDQGVRFGNKELFINSGDGKLVNSHLEVFTKRFQDYILITDGLPLPDLLQSGRFKHILDLRECIPGPKTKKPKEFFCP